MTVLSFTLPSRKPLLLRSQPAEIYARFSKDLNGRKLLLFLFLLRTSHPSREQELLGRPHTRLSSSRPSKLPNSGHCSGHAVYHDAFAALSEVMESPHQVLCWFQLVSW